MSTASPRVLVALFAACLVATCELFAEAVSPAVEQALRVEAAGDNENRNKLLEQAIVDNGDDRFARWNAGQLRVADAWRTAEDAAEAGKNNPKLAEYAARRERSKLTFANQSSLARWCERNGLAGPAMAHWTLALRLDNDSRVAQRALGVTRHRNRWLTNDEAAAAKDEDKELAARRKTLAKEIETIRKQLASEDPEQITDALTALERYADPFDVGTLVQAFAAEAAPEAVADRVTKRLLDAAGRVEEPWAVDFAVRVAVHADDTELRDRAVDTLRYRDETEYAPLLLAKLRAPVELSTNTYTDARGRVVNKHDAYREGPADNSYKKSYDRRYDAGPQYRILIRATPTSTRLSTSSSRLSCSPTTASRSNLAALDVVLREDPGYKRRHQRAYNSARYDAYRAYQDNESRNSLSEESNYRATNVLSSLAGEQLGASPREAWNWWQQKWDSDPELRERDRLSVGLGLVRNRPAGVASGTLVRTSTGPRPIDELRIGDEVLAKSPVTGELAYKPVLMVTTSEGRPLPELRLTHGRLAIADGQWLWSTGEGWRLPQDVHSDSLLHGLRGAARVAGQQQAEAPRVFSLVVADFHTFFAGPEQTLLHDASEPDHTDAATPGWSPITPVRQVAATDVER